MSEANMKTPENQPIPKSNLTDAQVADQTREEALKNFMHPENKPKIKQKSWLRRNLGRVLVTGALIATGTGIGVNRIIESNQPHQIEVPATFDPSAMNSVIGANNSVQMTWDEYAATAPELWKDESKTMTAPVPALFRDGRLPTLDITRERDPYDNALIRMWIDGFEQGDIILSPVDGEIELTMTHDNLDLFYLSSKDFQGEDVSILFQGPPLESFIKFDHQPGPNETVSAPIKKGQPIGKILDSAKDLLHRYKIRLMGFAPFIENFSLAATSGEKAVLLKK